MFLDFLGQLLEQFLGQFLNLGTRSAQEGAKMGPRGLSRTSKTQKAAFAKTFENLKFLKVFGVQTLPKRALGSPRRLPRGTRAPKPQQKGSQNGPKR
jgi:hypothetical protein